MTRTAWMAALRHAASVFGLSPDQFWRLSVAEWSALTESGPAPLRPAELAALLARFPDARVKEGSTDG